MKKLIAIIAITLCGEIYLPTGSFVSLTVNPKSKFFNVELHPSNNDLSVVSGLCGTFNKDKDDDCGGKTIADCGGYMYAKWQAKHDLFNDNSFSKLNRWQSTFGMCTCDPNSLIPHPSSLEGSVTCSQTNANNCNFDNKFRLLSSDRSCFVGTGRRSHSALHRRVDRFRRDVDVEDEDSRVWTEGEAALYCSNLFNSSEAVRLCSDIHGIANIIIENEKNCVLDIMATGGTSFAVYALESTKGLCMNEVELNSTLKEITQPGAQSIYEELVEVTCENECSGKGTCVNGTCECEEGFASNDCSRDKSVPPRILGMDLDGHCDVATETCNEAALIGDYFDEFGEIRCRFVPFKINTDGSIDKANKIVNVPMIESFAEAICILPKNGYKRSSVPNILDDSLMVTGYLISIANYGDAFSEEQPLVLYTAPCQACNVTGDHVSCRFTRKACIVGDQCIDHGEKHPEKPCYVCDASKPTRKWVKPDPECTDVQFINPLSSNVMCNWAC